MAIGGGWRWPQKPPVGTAIDGSHGLAQGLVFLAALRDYGGGTAYDAVTGLALPIAGAAWGAGVTSGLSCTSTTARAQAACPASLQLPGPATIAVAYRYLADPGTTNTIYFGTSYTSTNTSPYSSLQLGWHNTTDKAPALFYNSGGAFQQLNGTTAHVAGRDYVASASVQGGLQVLYLNGVPTGPTGGFAGPIAYGPAPQLAVGANTAYARLGGEINAVWRLFAPRRDVIRSSSTATGAGVSYPRGSSILRPVQVPTADLYCYLD
jgi:hypothetical protein